MSDIAAKICKAVAELPDRDSPQDWPAAMLVTHDELRQITIAALASAAAPQPNTTYAALPDVDALAQEIRRVDGGHNLGAGALAEALMPFLRASRGQAPAGAVPEVLDKATKHSHLKYTLTTSRAAFQAGALFALNTMRDQPAPAPSVLEDAARYQMVRRGQHWSVVDGIGDHLRGEALDAAVDAARKQGANHE